MSRQCNTANYSFLVESSRPNGKVFERFRIDQKVRNVNHRHAVEDVANTVQAHLSHLHEKTGLSYDVLVEGPLDEVDRSIKSLLSSFG